MVRPRVDPEKRLRIACACDSCKRRKQKCNGRQPCDTCLNRNIVCQYNTLTRRSAILSPGESSEKRRRIESSPDSAKEDSQVQTERSSTFGGQAGYLEDDGLDTYARPRVGSLGGPGEEAEVFPSQRMLQDPTGRLLYLGDSATLAFLQWIRMVVEGTCGPSKFTMDPSRHRIMEAKLPSLPSNTPIGVLPDRGTADVLVESFFANTTGLVEIFDRSVFLDSIDACYNDPLGTDTSVLCLLYLVFAIGLVLAKPRPRSPQETVIKRLREDKVNRAEVFYRNAKNLADPVSGFEDADFWSIQALFLMSIYMLSISKRNASYAYFGMAVRTAFALGLHREESMILFTPETRKMRRNLFRSLYFLDRFLAASLGRPITIHEEDCSEHALDPPQPADDSDDASDDTQTHLAALDMAAKICSVIGVTLKKIYSKRKVSTTMAQTLIDRLYGWHAALGPDLRRNRDPAPTGTTHEIAILHTDLLYLHTILLITRPFFIFIISQARQNTQADLSAPHKNAQVNRRMDEFAQICVEVSQYTLELAQDALSAEYLPQCNPFVIHFIFAAGLIILSNEFAGLYQNRRASAAIQSCKDIMRYCAELDKQAERISYVVEAFDDAIKDRQPESWKPSFPGRTVPSIGEGESCLAFERAGEPRYHPTKPDSAVSSSSSSSTLSKHEAAALLHASMANLGASTVPTGYQKSSPHESSISPIFSDVQRSSISSTRNTFLDMGAMEPEISFDAFWPNTTSTSTSTSTNNHNHNHSHSHNHNHTWHGTANMVLPPNPMEPAGVMAFVSSGYNNPSTAVTTTTSPTSTAPDRSASADALSQILHSNAFVPLYQTMPEAGRHGAF